MASCAYCGSTVVFGGKKLDGLTFCNANCLSKGNLVRVSRTVPDALVLSEARKIHSGACPVCNETRGPVEVHTSHKVASFLVMTRWSSTPRVSCKSCGRKSQVGALVYSMLIGWWGLPWGLIITPIQVGKNLFGIFESEGSAEPSDQLQRMVRMALASQAVARQSAPAAR